MAIDAFLDTNVLVYLLTPDRRADQAEALVAAGGVISVQVLNEFVSVAMRRHALSWSEIDRHLDVFRSQLQVEPLTIATQSRAVQIARTHQLHIYDANIMAVAQLAGCRTLYSEDMQDEFRLRGGPVVRNPFVAP